MDLKEETAVLRRKISEMKRQVLLTRNELLEMYDSDHLQPDMPNYKKRKSIFDKSISNDIYTEDSLKCCFFQLFVVIKSDEENNVVVAFGNEENEKFKARYIERDLNVMGIDKCYLPCFMNPERFIPNVNYIPVQDLPNTLFAIFRYIYAYTERKDQVKRFMNFDNKIGTFSQSDCTTQIRITLPIEISNNNKTTATIIITYDHLGIRPKNVSCEITEPEFLSGKHKKALVKKCNAFMNCELLEAYKKFCNFE